MQHPPKPPQHTPTLSFWPHVQLRVASERLGAQLDAVVSAYHVGFARSIQNYSQILEQFHEAKDQVRAQALYCATTRSNVPP